jgi:DNA-binding NarL/FixJ family response regulator
VDQALCRPVPGTNDHAEWHQAFLAMLPKIVAHCRVCFRGLLAEAREEAIQDAISHALAAYVRLVDQDKADCGFPTVLARHAVGHVRDGRMVGARQNSRDLLSRKAQLTKRFLVQQFSCFDEGRHLWSEAVIEDHRTPVPEQAAFRIDFPTWLDMLSKRDRRIAEELAVGQTTTEVAQRLGVSSARISQKRLELQTSWRVFQGEPIAEC